MCSTNLLRHTHFERYKGALKCLYFLGKYIIVKEKMSLTKHLTLIQKLKEPYKSKIHNYYPSDYVSIKERINEERKKEYVIYYHNKPDEYIRNMIIEHIFLLLNEISWPANFFDYYIPDNQVKTSYFGFELDLTQWDKIPHTIGKYYLDVDLPLGNYLNFYDARFHKVPLVSLSKSNFNVQFEHNWLRRITLR